jgi:hypothetical protein
MKKLLLVTAVLLPIFTAPMTSLAQSGWTSPCSAGATIDESSVTLYQTNGSSLFFRGAKTGTVTARYDVVNTAVPSVPVTPWTRLELGYFDPVGGSITATLFRVEPCTGNTTPICTLTSPPFPAPTCVACSFPGGTVDFLGFLYFVQVDIRRTSPNIRVQANTLRVF